MRSPFWRLWTYPHSTALKLGWLQNHLLEQLGRNILRHQGKKSSSGAELLSSCLKSWSCQADLYPLVCRCSPSPQNCVGSKAVVQTTWMRHFAPWLSSVRPPFPLFSPVFLSSSTCYCLLFSTRKYCRRQRFHLSLYLSTSSGTSHGLSRWNVWAATKRCLCSWTIRFPSTALFTDTLWCLFCGLPSKDLPSLPWFGFCQSHKGWQCTVRWISIFRAPGGFIFVL